ncbi:MAG: hypothetical protein PUF49_02810 [Firmicutes bacterium]|nr:hypothetical protein [Bacillota bacterium]
MIEKDILHIRWNTGQARINLKEYFPTSERRTRQLFRKLILLDDFQHEITEELIHWLTVQLNSIDGNSLKMYANDYANRNEKLRDLKGQLDANEKLRELIRDQYARERKPDIRRQLKEIQGQQRQASEDLRERISFVRRQM